MNVYRIAQTSQTPQETQEFTLAYYGAEAVEPRETRTMTQEQARALNQTELQGSGTEWMPTAEVLESEALRLQDEADSQTYQREVQMAEKIRLVFVQCGLEIAEENYSVRYQEKDREGYVCLDNYEVPLSSLAKLMQSGLSQDFTISSVTRPRSLLDVTFTLLPGFGETRA